MKAAYLVWAKIHSTGVGNLSVAEENVVVCTAMLILFDNSMHTLVMYNVKECSVESQYIQLNSIVFSISSTQILHIWAIYLNVLTTRNSMQYIEKDEWPE